LTITLDRKANAQLRDLEPGDHLAFSYDVVNGINVVNHIAQVQAPVEMPVADTGPY